MDTGPNLTMDDIKGLLSIRATLIRRQQLLRTPSHILAPVVTAIEVAVQEMRSIFSRLQDPEPLGSDW